MLDPNKILEDASKKCLNIVKDENIEIGEITQFSINDRASRWGRCTRNNKTGKYSIDINYWLTREDTPAKSLESTLLHEILHTVDGCMNHGPKWKHLAGILNRKYGYNIKRTTNAKESLSESVVQEYMEVRKKTHKYMFMCKKCGSVILRKRESKFTRNYQNYRCGKCGGTIVEIKN